MATQTTQPPRFFGSSSGCGVDRVVVVARVRRGRWSRAAGRAGPSRPSSVGRLGGFRLGAPRPARSRWGGRGRGWRGCEAARGWSSRPITSTTLPRLRRRSARSSRRRRPPPGRRRGGCRRPASVSRRLSLERRVDRLDPDLAARLADHAQHAVGALAQALDQPGLDLAALERVEVHQHPVAQPGAPRRLLVACRGARRTSGASSPALARRTNRSPSASRSTTSATPPRAASCRRGDALAAAPRRGCLRPPSPSASWRSARRARHPSGRNGRAMASTSVSPASADEPRAAPRGRAGPWGGPSALEASRTDFGVRDLAMAPCHAGPRPPPFPPRWRRICRSGRRASQALADADQCAE